MKKKKPNKNEEKVPNININNGEEIQLKCYYRNYAFEPDDETGDKVDNFRMTMNSDSKRSSNDNFVNKPSMSTTYNDDLNAINIKNLYFKYDSKKEWILNSLQLSVPIGTIYALIAPKKSGKTTILKLIIGLLKQTSGTIEIFDHKTTGEMSNKIMNYKNTLPYSCLIGYMPQALSIYEEMTTNQLLIYFGHLYHLKSKDEIKLRIKQLACQLKLENLDTPIYKLTLNQKYLVSLAISIVHGPKLILLDETTVNLCPEYRNIVWGFLKDLVKQQLNQTTVLITTSYFEEPKNYANLIGILRKGKLLVEKSPEQLLANCSGLNSLEKVYLKLFKLEKIKSKSTTDPVFLQIKQAVDNRIDQSFVASSYNDSQLPKRVYLKNLSSIADNEQNNRFTRAWFVIFICLLFKNFQKSIRRPNLCIIQLVLPLIMIGLFYLGFGHNPYDIRLGIVNSDTITIENRTEAKNYSKLFLENYIDPYYINQINYKNLDDAIRDVRTSRLFGILHIGEKFSNLINDRIRLNYNLTRKDIIKSTMFIHADLTNKFKTNFVELNLIRSFYKFAAHQLPKKYLNFIFLPFQFEDSIFKLENRNSIGNGYTDRNRSWKLNGLSSFILNTTFVLSICIASIQFKNERISSMFERQFLIKCRSSQIILAFLIHQFILIILQTILILILSVELFNLDESVTRSSVLLSIILLNLLNSLSGLSIGIFISFSTQKTSILILISNSLFLYLFIITGSLWPIESYSHFLRFLAKLHPTTLSSHCLENYLLSRSLNNYSGLLVSGLYSICFLILDIKKFRFIC